ncbi:YD repeat protein [Salinispira pacifica]|uniref:YD repeat protein n=2 Tax=Salinispira pacifica TaxID=1307761 RepID=V5WI56_9SPIO|nr:YD repeat protein [Salinispira pacifica]
MDPRTSRWISSDPAGAMLASPMGSDGKPRQNFSIIESLNHYSYVSNNPVKYVDPTGFKLMPVNTGLLMSSASANSTLGGSEELISNVGCVLTAYTRIASAIAGNEISLERANSVAIKLGLFSGENQNLLSVAAGAELISALTGKEIGYGSYVGPEQTLQINANYLSEMDRENYVTGRLNTESADGSQEYGHTVNITESLDVGDYIMGIDQQPIDDTSPTNREAVGAERDEELIRVDYFYVQE